MLVPPSAEIAARARRERNQGRAPDMGRVEHQGLGFNYRLPEVGAALGVAQLERIEVLLAERARVAALYRELVGPMEGVELPCEDRGDERRSWFVYVVQLPEGADRDEVIAELARRGVQSKAYLPCIHLLPFYRERFGFRGGEFPVAERVAERALALPFFTMMTADDVERVAGALAQSLGRRVPA
jgi:perosamine synthetase